MLVYSFIKCLSLSTLFQALTGLDSVDTWFRGSSSQRSIVIIKQENKYIYKMSTCDKSPEGNKNSDEVEGYY